MQIEQQQHGDQCCPNLDPNCVGRGADKGFDPQVLFNGFEEQLDLPALTIDLGDGFGAEVETIRDEDDVACIADRSR